MELKQLADKYLPKPRSIVNKMPRYATDDIINEVLLKFKETKHQVKQFAPFLKGATVLETCHNVWRFWKENITYVADNSGAGKQIVKSPAATWADKFCDCKSFSVAVNSCLQALGIKCVFRFVSCNNDLKTIPTHVYCIAIHEGREIIIDCCLKKFNVEKPYAAKYDYLEPGLYSVTGIGRGRSRSRTIYHNGKKGRMIRKRKPKELILDNVQTDAELGLVIHEQRLELEKGISEKIHGIGSTSCKCYDTELAAVNNAICQIGNPYLKAERTHLVAGIGKSAKKAEKKAAKKAAKVEKKTAKAIKKNEAGKAVNKKQAKLLEAKNITVVKKKEGILKKVAKVLTAPVRLVQKGVIQATLPKSAPAFLYLFLADNILAKAPEPVRRKHAAAKAYADKVINKVGMKKDHFMGILRNGIMQNMGDTPEGVLTKWMQDAGFNIGFVGDLIKSAAGMLGNILGSKSAALMNDAPDPSDWITIQKDVQQEVVNDMQQQNVITDPATGGGVAPVVTNQTEYNQATAGGGFDYSNVPIPTGNNTGTYSQNSGGAIPPAYNDFPYSAPVNTGSYTPIVPQANNPAAAAAAAKENEEVENKYGGEGRTLDDVTVTAKRNAAETGDVLDGGTPSNGLIIGGVLLAALVFAGGSKKGKR